MRAFSFSHLRPARRISSLAAGTALAALLLTGCATTAEGVQAEAAPVSAEAPAAAQASVARGPFVSAANPLAVEAGMKVLARGGSAVDAAVAIQAVLGLTEPQSSGLGGGAFMMFYEAESGAITVYDGRETAPASATPELFYENGKPLAFVDAVLSGRSTGAPGVVPMLALAQQQHGALAWSDLFGDAEALAQEVLDLAVGDGQPVLRALHGDAEVVAPVEIVERHAAGFADEAQHGIVAQFQFCRTHRCLVHAQASVSETVTGLPVFDDSVAASARICALSPSRPGGLRALPPLQAVKKASSSAR